MSAPRIRSLSAPHLLRCAVLMAALAGAFGPGYAADQAPFTGQGPAVTALTEGRKALDEGLAAYQKGQFQQAAEQFRRAVADPAVAAEAHLNLGRALIQLKNGKEGVAEIQKARRLGLSPENEAIADAAMTYVQVFDSAAAAGISPEKPVFRQPRYAHPWYVVWTTAVDFTSDLAVPRLLDPRGDVARENDWRFWTYLDGGYRWSIPSAGTVSLSYNFYENVYVNNNVYNAQLHRGEVKYTQWANQDVFFAVQFDYSKILIGSELSNFADHFTPGGYVLFHEAGPFWGRVQYTPDFHRYTHRLRDFDGDSHRVQFNQYWLFPNWDKYVGLQYVHEEERSDARFFSYAYDQAALTGRILITKDDEVTGKIAFEWYRYKANDWVELTKTRDDDIFHPNVMYTHSFTKNVALFASYDYQDSRSTLLRQRYKSHTATIGTTLRW